MHVPPGDCENTRGPIPPHTFVGPGGTAADLIMDPFPSRIWIEGDRGETLCCCSVLIDLFRESLVKKRYVEVYSSRSQD
jgi:hypothetical protein